MGGGEVEFGGDGGHGVGGGAEEEGHGGVEVFELFVVFGVPSAVCARVSGWYVVGDDECMTPW